MNLQEAINMAAGYLPDGWQVSVCAERGAGWIELHDMDGEKVEFDFCPDESLANQVDAAVSHAIKASALGEGESHG